MRHPSQVLFAGEKPFPMMPAVDHYAGSEKLIARRCNCSARSARSSTSPATARTVPSPVPTASTPRWWPRHHERGQPARPRRRPHPRHPSPRWQQDIEIIVGTAGQRLAFLTLPKVGGLDDVRSQLRVVQRVAAAAGLERTIPLHVLIETHTALREAWQIAALPEVESLDFGLMDFVSAHHGAIPGSAMKSPGQFDHPLVARAKCEIATAALANGVVPSHNVTTELRDLDLIHQDALRARTEFGYLRMWSIHPNQIVPIFEAMCPDFSEVEEATAILARRPGLRLGADPAPRPLHDRASYRYYWELLARARATGMQLPEAARQRFFA
jgi:citrate lyase subunit beta/citryl-CoA lyase